MYCYNVYVIKAMKTDEKYEEDILKHLKYVNAIPKAIRDMSCNLNSMMQAIARAAHEIEKLRKENKFLKQKNKIKK